MKALAALSLLALAQAALAQPEPAPLTSAPTALRIIAVPDPGPAAVPDIVGSPLAVTIEPGATSASIPITVPAPALGVLVFWVYAGSSAGEELTAISATFAGPFTRESLKTGALATYAAATGVAYAPVTAAGEGVLTITWPRPAGYGPLLGVAFVTGIEPSDWVRAVALKHAAGGTPVSVTLTATASDLVLAFDHRLGAAPPANPAGWSSLLTQLNVQEASGRLRRMNSPAAPSVTVQAQTLNWSTVAAVAVKGPH